MTGEYFLHLFTEKQPDLNWENPMVRKEVYSMMRFWLDKGIDGFRMDVIPLISKRPGLPPLPEGGDYMKHYATGPRLHEFLQEMNREVLSHYDIVTIGEAPGVPVEEALNYVGEDRNELNMIFHFDHMLIDHGPGGKFDVQPFPLHRFLSVFEKWDQALGEKGWNNLYLDNHDFPRQVSRFGNDKEYRVESAKLLATLLLTYRGTPTIYQGDEIGLPNTHFNSIDEHRDVETLNQYRIHIEQGGNPKAFLEAANHAARDHARTPVPWNEQPQGGFTQGTPWIKVNSRYREINVAQAEAEPDSVLHYYRKLLRIRKDHPVLVYGEVETLPVSEPLYAFCRELEDEKVWVLLNFSEKRQQHALDLSKASFWFGNLDDKASSAALKAWEAQVWVEKTEDEK
jgi:oligo-1,6-glucosidase